MKANMLHIPTIFSIRMQYHRLIQFHHDLRSVFHIKSTDSSCFPIASSGSRKNVFHFGIPDALLREIFPSSGTLSGAIGTPPPSALRFMAAAKIIFS